MQTSSFAWTILLSCFRVLLAPWSWCTTSTNWHQNKMVLLNLLLMLVQVLLEMVKFPRVIIQISDSNWPNPEIKEKNLFFSFSVGLGQAISVSIMFPHGLSAVPLLIHQTSLLPAKKRNTPELAISSWVYTIIVPLLGDVTSVTYSCGIWTIECWEWQLLQWAWQQWSELGKSSWLWWGDLLSRWAWQRNLQLLYVPWRYEPDFFLPGADSSFICR